MGDIRYPARHFAGGLSLVFDGEQFHVFGSPADLCADPAEQAPMASFGVHHEGDALRYIATIGALLAATSK